ncbi:uncharacterized protein CLUP02_16014 [Colletotrichum lupini]|uniref:Uncharacterized protein n=1 Tax=Colletotrichum lupini TaxID=145971 RepID=A0A9Q8T755_9PEZI|nr:uncharacterized protein CLUP02_16014 [Colletotrichum lupini]UQC90484.1 hypothetical protein CLUP02_16014 [Colletotrichum lupini]
MSNWALSGSVAKGSHSDPLLPMGLLILLFIFAGNEDFISKRLPISTSKTLPGVLKLSGQETEPQPSSKTLDPSFDSGAGLDVHKTSRSGKRDILSSNALLTASFLFRSLPQLIILQTT